MPIIDESNRGLNALDLPRHPTMESAAATPAKRQVILVPAAVIAVIDFQKMAQAQIQRAGYKNKFLVS